MSLRDGKQGGITSPKYKDNAIKFIPKFLKHRN